MVEKIFTIVRTHQPFLIFYPQRYKFDADGMHGLESVALTLAST